MRVSTSSTPPQRSEEFIGRFIADRRNDYYLATKMGRSQTGVPEGRHWSRQAMVDSLDASLARFGTDYVDVLQLHGPTVEEAETYDVLGSLQRIKTSGKARFIGVSAVLPHLDTFVDWNVFDTFQIVYSALEPEHEEAISKAVALGAGTIIRGGSVKGAPLREAGRGNEFPVVRNRWVRSALHELLGDVDIVQTLFRYALGHPSAHTFINRTQDLSHLKANIEAVESGPLDADLQAAIRERVIETVNAES
jgi:aryl-alcohol dehydrogenase-like predicted oxidoreductase